MCSSDLRGYNTTWEYKSKCKEVSTNLGYEAGAVVTRKEQPSYSRTNPDNWGIVSLVVAYEDYKTQYYAPIKVKWLNGTEMSYYPDELIIVQYKPDDIDLGIIRRGGID